MDAKQVSQAPVGYREVGVKHENLPIVFIGEDSGEKIENGKSVTEFDGIFLELRRVAKKDDEGEGCYVFASFEEVDATGQISEKVSVFCHGQLAHVLSGGTFKSDKCIADSELVGKQLKIRYLGKVKTKAGRVNNYAVFLKE